MQFAVLILTLPVTARLIEPSAFGAYAIALTFATVCTQGLSAMVDQGIVDPIDLTSEHRSNLLAAVRRFGLLLGLVIVSLSAAYGWVVGDRGIVSAGFILSMLPFVQGRTRLAQADRVRSLDFRRLAAAQGASYLLGYLPVTVGLAAAGFGSSGLAFGYLSQQAIYYLVVRHADSRIDSGGSAKIVLAQYRTFGAAGAFHTASTQVDNLVLGARLGAASVGQYSRGYRVASLPANIFSDAVGTVLLPSYARVRDDSERLRLSTSGGLLLTTILVMPPAIVMYVASDAVVSVVLGPGWTEAARILSALAPIAVIRSWHKVTTTLCRAVDSGRAYLAVTATQTLTVAIAVGVGTIFGSVGAAVGLVMANLVVVGGLVLRLSSSIPRLGRSLTGVAVASVGPAVGVSALCSMVVVPASMFGILVMLAGGWIVGGLVVVASAAAGWGPASWLVRQVGATLKRADA